MCFFKPKISIPKVEAPKPAAQAATPVADLPTPEAAILGGSDEENKSLGGGTNKKNKSGKSQLKIDLKQAAPKTSTTTGANRGLNTKR